MKTYRKSQSAREALAESVRRTRGYLASRDYRMAVAELRVEPAEHAAENIRMNGHVTMAISCIVANRSGVSEMMRKAVSKWGRRACQ